MSWRTVIAVGLIYLCAYAAFGVYVWNVDANYNQAAYESLEARRLWSSLAIEHKSDKSSVDMYSKLFEEELQKTEKLAKPPVPFGKFAVFGAIGLVCLMALLSAIAMLNPVRSQG